MGFTIINPYRFGVAAFAPTDWPVYFTVNDLVAQNLLWTDLARTSVASSGNTVVSFSNLGSGGGYFESVLSANGMVLATDANGDYYLTGVEGGNTGFILSGTYDLSQGSYMMLASDEYNNANYRGLASVYNSTDQEGFTRRRVALITGSTVRWFVYINASAATPNYEITTGSSGDGPKQVTEGVSRTDNTMEILHNGVSQGSISNGGLVSGSDRVAIGGRVTGGALGQSSGSYFYGFALYIGEPASGDVDTVRTALGAEAGLTI